jgi:hypothetical protein
MLLVVAGTVAVYGLGAGPLAHRLGLAAPDPQGLLVIGAHRFARELARAVREQGYSVQLVDTNPANVAQARQERLPVHEGSALSDSADEEIDLSGLGRVLALTANDETNALCAHHYLHLFGRREIYQLASGKAAIAPGLRGRVLFGPGWTYDRLDARLEAGARIRATRLAADLDFARWSAIHGKDAVPLLVLSGGRLTVATADRTVAPAPGDTLIGLVGGPAAQ